MEWYLTLGLAAGTAACIVLLAYLIKAQREFVKLILQEKVDAINTVLPLIEAVAGIVPPDVKPKVQSIIDVLTISREINQALINAPVWRLHSTYARLKFKARR